MLDAVLPAPVDGHGVEPYTRRVGELHGARAGRIEIRDLLLAYGADRPQLPRLPNVRVLRESVRRAEHVFPKRHRRPVRDPPREPESLLLPVPQRAGRDLRIL